MSLCTQVVERHSAGGAATGVEPVKLLGLGVPHDGEQIATDATPRGLHEAERSVRRNGCVDRRSAGFEDVDADLTCERVGTGHHSVRRDHW